MSKFAAWVTVSDKGVEEMKGGNGLTLFAWEGHSKKDKESGEWVPDGTTSYVFTVFDDTCKEIASELKPKDKVFVAGRFRQKKIVDGKGDNKTEKWVSNYVVDMIFTTFEDHNDAIDDIREYLAPVKKIREE